MGPTPKTAADGIRTTLRHADPRRVDRVSQFLEERGKRLFMADGRERLRDRQRLNHVFTSRRIAALREPIHEICDELIDGFDTSGPVELVAAYANLVAARSLGRILGADAAHRDDFVAWAGGINAALAPIPDDQLPAVAATIDDYLLYFGGEIEARRAQPGDDLLSAIVTGRDEVTGAQFSTPEILGLLGQFVAAGVATTSSGIASVVHELAIHADLAKFVRENPDRLDDLVNEILRLESPVQGLFRIATEATTIGEAAIAAGDNVLVFFAAANRDPAAFPDPDRIDLDRPNRPPHLAFGYGVHYCIGALLGATEIAIAVRALLDRFTTITVPSQPPAYIPMLILRGLAALETNMS